MDLAQVNSSPSISLQAIDSGSNHTELRGIPPVVHFHIYPIYSNNSGEKKWTLHEAFACRHWPWLARAMECNSDVNDYVEDRSSFDRQTRTMKIFRCAEKTFICLAHWMYLQDVDFATSRLFRSSDGLPILELRSEGTHGVLCDLWHLANYLEIPKLQNQIIRKLWELRGTFLTSGIARRILEEPLIENQSLRKFFAFCWASQGDFFGAWLAEPEKLRIENDRSFLDDVGYYHRTEFFLPEPKEVLEEEPGFLDQFMEDQDEDQEEEEGGRGERKRKRSVEEEV